MQNGKAYEESSDFEDLLPSKRNSNEYLGHPCKRPCNSNPLGLDIDFFLKELDEIFTNPNKRVEICDTLPKNTIEQLTKIEDSFKIKQSNYNIKHEKEENNQMIIEIDDIKKIQDEISSKLEENNKLELSEALDSAIEMSFNNLSIPEKIKTLLSQQDSSGFWDRKPLGDDNASQLKQDTYENKNSTSTSQILQKSREIDLSSLKAEIPKSLQPAFSLPYIIKPSKSFTNLKSISYKIYTNSI